MKTDSPSCKLSDKFEFSGIKAVPFGEGGGEAVGRGSDLHRSVYLIYRSVCSLLLSLVPFFYLCANAARAHTFFQTKKKVCKEVLLVRIFSAEFFLALRARKKLRVENASVSLYYRQCSNGSGTAIRSRKTLSVNRALTVTVGLISFVPDEAKID